MSNSDQRGAARLLPFGLSPLFPYGPIRLIYSPANSRNSPVLRKIPESLGTFPKSNIVAQYIDLYVSAILRLLVKSLISSETPNSFGTSKLINS